MSEFYPYRDYSKEEVLSMGLFELWPNNKDWARLLGTNLIWKYSSTSYGNENRWYLLNESNENSFDRKLYFREANMYSGSDGAKLIYSVEDLASKLPEKYRIKFSAFMEHSIHKT